MQWLSNIFKRLQILFVTYMHINITDMHWQYFDLEDKLNPKGKHKAGRKHVS